MSHHGGKHRRANCKAERERRRKEAEERFAASAALSAEERLRRLDNRMGEAARERKRLRAMVA